MTAMRSLFLFLSVRGAYREHVGYTYFNRVYWRNGLTSLSSRILQGGEEVSYKAPGIFEAAEKRAKDELPLSSLTFLLIVLTLVKLPVSNFFARFYRRIKVYRWHVLNRIFDTTFPQSFIEVNSVNSVSMLDVLRFVNSLRLPRYDKGVWSVYRYSCVFMNKADI